MEKRIYFFIGVGWGTVARTLPIANALRATGMKTFFHASRRVRQVIASAGHIPISPTDLPQMGTWTPQREWWNFDQYLANLGWSDTAFVEQQYLGYRAIIEQIKPDVIVTDLHVPGSMVARSLHIPTLSIAQSCFLPSRTHPHIVWWKKPPAELPSVTPAINTVLEKYGTEPISCTEDLQIGDITVLPSFPEFDPIVSIDAKTHYVGPILDDTMVTTRLPDAMVDKKLIFLYPGRSKDSSGDSGLSIMETVVPALEAMDIPTLVSTGGFEYAGYEQNRGSVFFTNWVSLLSLAPQCEIIIHHGGHETILTAILAGIPQLVLPTFAEREYNARNLVALGLGRMIPFEEFSPKKVQEEIEQLRSDPSYTNNAQAWRDTIKKRNYGGINKVIELVTSLLG